jgi:hypothetical protein
MQKGVITTTVQEIWTVKIVIPFFLDFPIYLQAVEIHSANGVMGGEGG